MEIDKLLMRPDVSGIFFGRSVIPGFPVFASVRGVDGKTIATAQGKDFSDALQKLLPRKMPGL